VVAAVEHSDQMLCHTVCQCVGSETGVQRHAFDCKRSVALGEVAALPQYLGKDIVDKGKRHKPLPNFRE